MRKVVVIVEQDSALTWNDSSLMLITESAASMRSLYLSLCKRRIRMKWKGVLCNLTLNHTATELYYSSVTYPTI